MPRKFFWRVAHHTDSASNATAWAEETIGDAAAASASGWSLVNEPSKNCLRLWGGVYQPIFDDNVKHFDFPNVRSDEDIMLTRVA